MISTRPYSLFDEIKMHVFTWACDQDWNKLPVAMKESLTTVMNEVKIVEVLRESGENDERIDEKGLIAEKRKYIAIFKQKYMEYCDFAYSGGVDAGTQFIISGMVKKLSDEGFASMDYLCWFFDDFMRDEYNKTKYAPPTIKLTTSNFVYEKFLFQNKDKAKLRKRDIQEANVRNAISSLATEFLKKERDKEFGQKLLEFARGEISIRKFCGIFTSLLEKKGETKTIEELKTIIGSEQQ